MTNINWINSAQGEELLDYATSINIVNKYQLFGVNIERNTNSLAHSSKTWRLLQKLEVKQIKKIKINWINGPIKFLSLVHVSFSEQAFIRIDHCPDDLNIQKMYGGSGKKGIKNVFSIRVRNFLYSIPV